MKAVTPRQFLNKNNEILDKQLINSLKRKKKELIIILPKLNEPIRKNPILNIEIRIRECERLGVFRKK